MRATTNTFTLLFSTAPDTSSATSCVTSSATSCAASCAGSSLTCSSVTCHLRASAAWVPLLADGNPSSTAPNKSSATSCVTSSAKSCAASFMCLSLTCSSFTCHLRASVAWVPPLADGDGQDKHLHDKHLRAPVLRGSQHALRHVLRQVLHV